MSNALMLAIIGTLRPVPVVGIVSVGSAATTGIVTTDASGNGAVACTLPTGCNAGDTVVLTCNGNNTLSFTWIAPAAASVVIASTTGSTVVYAVYVATLIQANVDAGTVSVPYTAAVSSGVAAAVCVDSYRTLDSTPVDVVGSFMAGTFPASATATATVPGITTTIDNDLLQYAVFTALTTGFISSTPPVGWVAGASQSGVNARPCLTGYMLQSAHTATGDVPVTISTNLGNLSGPYAAVLLSLRPYNPVFRLTGTLPGATATVPYSATMTLAGTHTGTVTISASSGSIPSWMTASVSGNTVTYSGTPPSATTNTFTPQATDSTSPTAKVAIGSSQSIVVAAAPTSPVLVQQAVSLGSSSATTLSVTLATAPVAGNTLVLTLARSSTSTPSVPSGWTLVSSTFAGSTTGTRQICKRTADGTEGTTISISTAAGNTGFAIQEWTGSVTVTAAEGGQTTAGTGSFAVGPFAAPAASSVPAVFAMFNGNSPMPPATFAAGWTGVGPLSNGSFPARGETISYGAATASSISAVTTTYTGTRGNAVVVLWVGAWIS